MDWTCVLERGVTAADGFYMTDSRTGQEIDDRMRVEAIEEEIRTPVIDVSSRVVSSLAAMGRGAALRGSAPDIREPRGSGPYDR